MSCSLTVRHQWAASETALSPLLHPGCRYKEPRTNWVYSTPGAVESKRRSSTDTSCEQPQQQQQQQQLNMATSEPQQQQQDAVEPFGDAAHHHEHMQESGRASAQLDQQSGSSEQQHHPQLENLSCQGTQQEQQQQHTDSPQEQPPIVEYGLYFSRQPVRVFTGHTEDILDVTWSAGGFILTASLDKSVRLWHVSQPDCLREFWHTDFVTSVQFHPLDAQRFVSGQFHACADVDWLSHRCCNKPPAASAWKHCCLVDWLPADIPSCSWATSCLSVHCLLCLLD